MAILLIFRLEWRNVNPCYFSNFFSLFRVHQLWGTVRLLPGGVQSADQLHFFIHAQPSHMFIKVEMSSIFSSVEGIYTQCQITVGADCRCTPCPHFNSAPLFSFRCIKTASVFSVGHTVCKALNLQSVRRHNARCHIQFCGKKCISCVIKNLRNHF